LRQRAYRILEAVDNDPVARGINISLAILVSLNALAVILETVPSLEARWSRVFTWFEEVSVTIFLVEYVVRLWSCTVARDYSGAVSGRIRFAARPLSMVDAIAIAPALLPGEYFLDLRYVRVMRLVRMLRVFKFTRYTETVRTFARVVTEKRADLVLIGLFLGLLLVVASASMYFAEYDEQPDVFSSIPAAMWWAMQTLTTVGYGDIVPRTPWGKFLGTLIALLGIGFFALPAGILAAGFAEELQSRKEKEACPNCGHERGPRRSRG
jgi:voltage-gated potassium channel